MSRRERHALVLLGSALAVLGGWVVFYWICALVAWVVEGT